LIEINDGFTEIAIGSDVIKAQLRDPLTSARVASGARITLKFQRRVPLPPRSVVNVRYDLAENGCEREVQGVPQLSHTVMEGEQVIYHYRLAYWLAPHALMRFVPSYVRQRTDDLETAPENFPEASVSG
jgi:hypothetical protein